MSQYANRMVRNVLDFWVDLAEEFDRIDAKTATEIENKDERRARQIS